MCTEQTFAWLSQYKKIYVQCSRHTISSFYELLCIKMHAYKCVRKPLLPKLRKLGDLSTKFDNHFYIHRVFLLDSSYLLNCYIPQGINLQHIPGPAYDALKVWAWGFMNYMGLLSFRRSIRLSNYDRLSCGQVLHLWAFYARFSGLHGNRM